MKKRSWLFLVGSALSALVPACKSTPEPGLPEPLPFDTSAQVVKSEPAAKPGSPYHPLPDVPVELPDTVTKPAEFSVKKAADAPSIRIVPAADGDSRAAEIIRIAGQEPKPLPIADEPLVAACRAFVEKHPDTAAEALKRLDKTTSDVLLAWMPLAVRL